MRTVWLSTTQMGQTRTIVDSLMPKWNEQNTWEVFDTCIVITSRKHTRRKWKRYENRERENPRHPPHMDTRLSHADAVHPDELDEEFDTFPTSRSPEMVRMGYDRLRSIGGRVQTVVGDLATQGERFLSLLSWRDPRATTLFMFFCLVAAIVLYVTPFQVVALLTGIYVLRHPRFRHKLPSVPLSLFRRLPARSDSLL